LILGRTAAPPLILIALDAKVGGIAFAMRLLTVALGSCLVMLTACSDDPGFEDTTERDESGEIAEAGDIGVMRLQLGDCLVLPDSMIPGPQGSLAERSVQTELQGVPCSASHNGEIVMIDEAFFEDYSDGGFPGFEQLETVESYEACVTGLDAYTGTVYEETNFDILPLFPDESSWESMDDRELVCIGVTLDADSLDAGQFEVIDTTGSMAAD
jgi:hypothetical protein